MGTQWAVSHRVVGIEVAGRVLQELIEAEATEVIGAARYERSDARVTERSGHRPRLLATQAGDALWAGYGMVPMVPGQPAELSRLLP